MDFKKELTRRDFMRTLVFGGTMIVLAKYLLNEGKMLSTSNQKQSLSFKITAAGVSLGNKNAGEIK